MSVLGFGLILLSACAKTPEPIQISTIPVTRPQLTLPPVDELNLRDVKWVVINAENLEEKIAELTANGQPLAIFVLTADGYTALSLNLSDIRALIEQQRQIILAYENYYRAANAALDKAVIVPK